MSRIVNYLFQGKGWIRVFIIFAGIVLAETVLAAPTVSISGIQTNVDKTVSSIAKILEDIALIAGIGFIMASFFKFHQHKQNPQQVQLSQGVTLLVIGAGLAVFPHLLATTTYGVLGVTKVEKVGGTAITGIIGS